MVKKEGMSNKEIQQALIENFVNMQKVLTNISIKFDNLSDNIARLLQIFEITAKSFVKKTEEPTPIFEKEDKELVNKLDSLLEQNKTIAKGLTLIEEKIRHKIYGENTNPQNTRLISTARFQKENNSETKDWPSRSTVKPLPKI